MESAGGKAGAFCGVVGVGLAIRDIPIATVSVCLLVRGLAGGGGMGGGGLKGEETYRFVLSRHIGDEGNDALVRGGR